MPQAVPPKPQRQDGTTVEASSCDEKPTTGRPIVDASSGDESPTREANMQGDDDPKATRAEDDSAEVGHDARRRSTVRHSYESLETTTRSLVKRTKG